MEDKNFLGPSLIAPTKRTSVVGYNNPAFDVDTTDSKKRSVSEGDLVKQTPILPSLAGLQSGVRNAYEFIMEEDTSRAGQDDQPMDDGSSNSEEGPVTNDYEDPTPVRPARRRKTVTMEGVQVDDGDCDDVQWDSIDLEEPVEPPPRRDFSTLDNVKWDPFRESTADTELYSYEKCYKISIKILKVLFILVLFVLLLACLVVNKVLLLFITSNLNPHVAFINNWNEKSPASNASVCGAPTCAYEGNRDLKVVRWVWCLVMILATPYFFTMLRSWWKIFFKKKRSPSAGALTLVMVVHTLHSVGIFLLLFLGLPQLDVIRGLLTLCAVGFFPSLLRLLEGDKERDEVSLKTEDINKPKIAIKIVDALAFVANVSALLAWIVYLSFNPITPGNKEMSDVCSSSDMPTITSSLFLAQGLSESNDTNGSTTTPTFQTSTVHFIPTPKPLNETLPESAQDLWSVPLGLFLISLVWWENFLNKKTKLGKLGDILNKQRQRISGAKTKIYAVVSIWKMVCTFLLVLLFFGTLEPWGLGISSLFDRDNFLDDEGKFEIDWLIVWGTVGASGLLSYWCFRLAVRGLLQVTCVAVPMMLSTPVTAGLLLWGCYDCGNEPWNQTKNYLHFWNCFSGHQDVLELFTERWVGWLGVLWWLAEMWTCRHLWFSRMERLAETDKIFVQPYYCGGILGQSLAFNRRVRDKDYVQAEAPKRPDLNYKRRKSSVAIMEPDSLFKRDDDKVPMIYACATMWHETEAEMIQILKSIFKLDIDQHARSAARRYLKVDVEDYYDFEAHVFFDDAFENHAEDDDDFKVNVFVKQFVRVIDQAALSVHKKNIEMKHPHKYVTPYGGRLEYDLPGSNVLVVHLKDKIKIRHKKRWSQVMYMYYFLGHRLWAQNEPVQRKQTVAENTFILALDGDVDFVPKSLQLLVDLLKKDKRVGAACGRIHPVGAGPIVWYQKFEYALAHWLAKPTEHVLGCVLCSPGCFSLFRGSALMDDNVMKKYTTRATEASHYLQYDQGEDRWLCTLLLQQGHRVEYSAAADALTYAPEGFNEFFNQRRRWTPSTFANLLDLLTSFRSTVKKNDNISTLYMVYQAGLFGSSILGPATIFLLIVSSFHIALSISKGWALVLTIIPIILYLIICLTLSTEVQLMVAALLSTIFAVGQVVVLVGICIQIAEDGICHPNTMLLIFIVAVFVISALLHPQEAFNLLHGMIYYLLIPCMYLVLIIYSLCNLHVVSWGPREQIQTKAAKEAEEAKKMEAAAKKAEKEGLLSALNIFAKPATSEMDGETISCGNVCKCFCCLRPGESPTDQKISQLSQQLTNISVHIDEMSKPQQTTEPTNEQTIEIPESSTDPDRTEDDLNSTEHAEGERKSSEDNDVQVEDTGSNTGDEGVENTDSDGTLEQDTSPPWVKDRDLGKGPKRHLNPSEIKFWKQLIEKYLKPLYTDKEEQESAAKKLKALRNKAVFAFILTDVMLITLIEALTLTIESETSLAIRWMCTDPITGTRDEVVLDPVALVFIVVFGVIIAIQFLCLFSHRLLTFLQIVATTPFTKSLSENDRKRAEAEAAIAMANEMSKLGGDEGDDKTINSGKTDGTSSVRSDEISDDHKTPVAKKLASKGNKVATMEQAFVRKFFGLKAIVDDTETGEPSIEVDHTAPEDPHEMKRYQFRRRRSLFPEFRNQQTARAHHPHGALAHILRRKDDIFDPEVTDELKTRYNLSGKDIEKEKKKVQKMLPEIDEIVPPPDY